MVPAQRNNSVTLLRLVAAFLVLSGHMSRICGITPIILFGEQVHSMGVKIFFCWEVCLLRKAGRKILIRCDMRLRDSFVFGHRWQFMY